MFFFCILCVQKRGSYTKSDEHRFVRRRGLGTTVLCDNVPDSMTPQILSLFLYSRVFYQFFRCLGNVFLRSKQFPPSPNLLNCHQSFQVTSFKHLKRIHSCFTLNCINEKHIS
ncbi:unnamed protein product [Chrysodeixis includens]|uniref:Uncharacterized protein n=1 Tax=Chrysodeixis includens TaxID=689277 RepID=A0A9N8L296_CHRIL|nr:unnamed protein product [Chrysodeixis includens]